MLLNLIKCSAWKVLHALRPSRGPHVRPDLSQNAQKLIALEFGAEHQAPCTKISRQIHMVVVHGFVFWILFAQARQNIDTTLVNGLRVGIVNTGQRQS